MPPVTARILLWGIAGSGKTTTLETICARLRDDLRGDLRQQPTRLDPTLFYESLTITLGEVGGVGARIELIAVPGAPDQEMTRKQLLDQVDGILLVLDCSPDRIRENRPAVEELARSLDAYGQRLDAFPVVLQYNKRDAADPFAIEDLHREMGFERAAVFETIATTGHGVLPALTTISKFVVRARRGAEGAAALDDPHPTVEPSVAPLPATDETRTDSALPATDETRTEPPFSATSETTAASTAAILESAILAEAEARDPLHVAGLDEGPGALPSPLDSGEAQKPSEGGLRVISTGEATVDPDGGVRLPLVLGDEDGNARSVVLSLRIDSVVTRGEDD